MYNINTTHGEYDQRTYTVDQIARILGVSERKAYSLCETTTDFKVMRLGKRCLRIHKESFEQWLNKMDDAS
jgi:excisionase family DNA binding protein